MLSANVHAVVP